MKKPYTTVLILNGAIYGILWIGILNFNTIKEETKNLFVAISSRIILLDKTIADVDNNTKGPISDSLDTESNKKLVKLYYKNTKL
jgi:hypothetical protein